MSQIRNGYVPIIGSCFSSITARQIFWQVIRRFGLQKKIDSFTYHHWYWHIFQLITINDNCITEYSLIPINCKSSMTWLWDTDFNDRNSISHRYTYITTGYRNCFNMIFNDELEFVWWSLDLGSWINGWDHNYRYSQ